MFQDLSLRSQLLEYISQFHNNSASIQGLPTLNSFVCFFPCLLRLSLQFSYCEGCSRSRSASQKWILQVSFLSLDEELFCIVTETVWELLEVLFCSVFRIAALKVSMMLSASPLELGCVEFHFVHKIVCTQKEIGDSLRNQLVWNAKSGK